MEDGSARCSCKREIERQSRETRTSLIPLPQFPSRRIALHFVARAHNHFALRRSRACSLCPSSLVRMITFLKIYLCISAGKDVAINDDQVTGGVPKVWIVESIRVQVDKTTPNILDPSLGQRTGYWQPYNYLLENYLMANKPKNARD